VKYAANAFLAAKISFINEISLLCERVGADVKRVSQGIGLDKRIGQAFLNAGIGWGGSCFPKDTSSLVAMAEDYGLEMPMMTAVQKVNRRQKSLVIARLLERLKRLKGKTVTVLGLAFKPGTDDLRASPAMEIAQMLHAHGARVQAYDPQVKSTERLPEYVTLHLDPYAACGGAAAIVLCTEWPEFQKLDWLRVSAVMGGSRRRVIVDGRNILDGKFLAQVGFDYQGIGR
jgi:UDPglucose 6-dehydrogenase